MIFRVLSILLAIALFAPAQAFAQSARVVTERAESVLAPERAGFAPGETLWFAFAQKLEPGWHVYWLNPGDSGLPLTLDWTLPEGFVAGEPVYPTPERIPVGPIANYGFHGDPIFLAPVTAPASLVAGQSIGISVDATWLICEEICVPEDGRFELSLVSGAAPPAGAPGGALVEKARAAIPAAYDGAASFRATSNSLMLTIAAPEGFAKDAFFFPEAEGVIEPAAPQTATLTDGQLKISMAPGFAYDPNALEELRGVLATSDRHPARGVAISASNEGGAALAGSANASGGPASVNLVFLLGAAFFGGVLLNIMPCVFPVIFIKAASLMRLAESEQSVARRHGGLFALGVLASFAALGGALLVLRAGGEQLGWGFHLQSPIVVALSAYVLFLVALNLAGVFEIGESLQSAGGGLAERGGDVGAFFTGVLAVVVAAPCIGPLLTAPIGAAAFLPPLWGMAIFLLMGLGLSAPYLLLSFAPSLGRWLPKPGPWMAVFKQALSFPVFAAAAYFLWVLAQQSGQTGLAAALTGAVLLAAAAWLFQLSKGDGARAIWVRVSAAVFALFAIAPVMQVKAVETAAASTGATKHGALSSVVFDPAMIPDYQADGRGVFVDFTAAWCVTCQFNKLTIFSKPTLAAAFEREDVVLMVADWTRRDPEITKALEGFGANGVPLYVYYPPQGAPRVLSLPISEKSVTNAISG